MSTAAIYLAALGALAATCRSDRRGAGALATLSLTSGSRGLLLQHVQDVAAKQVFDSPGIRRTSRQGRPVGQLDHRNKMPVR